jgi:hypothetical protein
MVDFNAAFGAFNPNPQEEMLRQRMLAMAAGQGGQTAIPMQPMAPPMANPMQGTPMAPGNMLERGPAVAPQYQPQVGFGGNRLEPQREPATGSVGAPMDLTQVANAPAPQQAMQTGDRPATQRGFDPDRLEMLQDLFIGWASGQNVTDSLAKGALMMREGKKGRTEKKQTEERTNQTIQYLQSKGMDPTQAAMVAGNPTALNAYLQSTLQPQGGMNPDRFKSVGGQLYDVQTGQWLSPPAGGGTDAEYGLNPQYGTDQNGNPVLIQIGKDGKAVQTALPDGVSLSKEPIRLDAGTHFVLLDPITRQPVGTVAKNLAGAEVDKATGKAQGEAMANLPNAEVTAKTILDMIQGVRNHPGRETATGMSSVIDPRNYIPGTEATNFRSRLDQLQGQTFLQAFESLKGGGQITEVEGKKAEQAIARLNTAQSEQEFMTALTDLESVVNTALSKAQRKAGVATTAPGGEVKRYKYNPATGELE